MHRTKYRSWIFFIAISLFIAIVPQAAIPAVPNMKDVLVDKILDQLTIMYSPGNSTTKGKTFKVTIKDFSVDDDETYLIVEGIARTHVYQEPTDDFWRVTLPRRLKTFNRKHTNDLSILLGGQHQVDIVRKDLVSATRRNGIVREITIPKELKPLK